MSKPNYLNVILTLNVVMLALLIVMGLNDKPIFGQTAVASPNPSVFPNGTEQRRKMISELRVLNHNMERLLDRPAGSTEGLAQLREDLSQDLWRQHRELKLLLKSGRIKVTLSDGRSSTSALTDD